MTNETGRLRVQEYQHGENAKRLVWAVWSATGDGKNFSARLDAVPGKLLDAQRMPLAPDSTSGNPATQDGEGRVEVRVEESPLYLFFEKP